MIFKFKEPKNSDCFSWTKHSFEKMKFYGLSAQRVLRVVKHPERCEQGVAEGCTACMQSLGSKNKSELWVMYQDVVKSGKAQRKIITAWRYPGKSPVREQIPIPKEILDEIKDIIKIYE